MINIYVGWDPREQVAYDIACASLLRRTQAEVNIIPLKLDELRTSGLLTRRVERRGNQLWCPISDAPMATEFAVSRFCVPFLQSSGWAVFMDCDVLVNDDISKLLDLADPSFAMMCVKHQPSDSGKQKMDGQVQTYYSRKNWSSVMLWNCNHPAHRILTREALNNWPGRDLHAFSWLKDSLIGELDPEWNYLADVSPKLEHPKLIHYTLGTPNLPGYENCEFADLWHEELAVNSKLASKQGA